MKRYLILASSITLSCLSCNPCNNKSMILTGCAHKYWDIYNLNNGHFSGLIGAYRLSKNGTCYFLKWYEADKKRDFFHDGDYVPNYTWQMKNDTQLNICNRTYRIITFSKDSIVLKPSNDSSRVLLVISHDQTDNTAYSKD